MSENVVLVENTRALYAAAEQLIASGVLLTLLNVIAIVVGLLLAALVIMDWSRRRWGSFPPALLVGTGFATIGVGFVLLGIVGTPVGFPHFAVAGDEATQILLIESKQVSAPLAALAVAAMSSGTLYITLGGAALWKNKRQRREERQLRMERATA